MENSFFKILAQDLLNLEINTIIKPEMSACKMPASRRIALWQLAGWYDAKLAELGVRGDICWKSAGIRSFGELRDRAQKGIEAYQDRIKIAPQEERASLGEAIEMLGRISDQSSQVVGMFKRAWESPGRKTGEGYDAAPEMRDAKALPEKGPIREAFQKALLEEGKKSRRWNNDIEKDEMNRVDDLELMPDQITMIRKAWDIGTERIVLQTVIQLDGDVTTRMSEAFAANPNQTILKIHNDSVLTAAGFWSNLVKILVEIAGKAAGLILGR